MQVSITVNGQQRTDDVEPRLLLAHYLRETCGLKATNIGCDTTSCGACTVIVDGLSVKSCTVLAASAEGSQVTTLEGLGTVENPGRLQRAFIEEQAAQCGYCIPGMIVRAHALLVRNPDPSDAEIRRSLNLNLCRCGTQNRMVRAVLRAGGSDG